MSSMDSSETIIAPIDLNVAAKVQVGGQSWFRRPEFHVTTFTPDDLAEATGVPEDILVQASQKFREELSSVRGVAFDGRVACAARSDGRRSLVAFCLAPGLDEIYEKISVAVGSNIPPPITHITLYTVQPQMKGIGLTTAAQVEAYTTMLAEDEASAVLAGVSTPEQQIHCD